MSPDTEFWVMMGGFDDGSADIGGSNLAVGAGIELVNSGGADGLPPVSRDVTRVPVVSGFVPVSGGGI